MDVTFVKGNNDSYSIIRNQRFVIRKFCFLNSPNKNCINCNTLSMCTNPLNLIFFTLNYGVKDDRITRTRYVNINLTNKTYNVFIVNKTPLNYKPDNKKKYSEKDKLLLCEDINLYNVGVLDAFDSENELLNSLHEYITTENFSNLEKNIIDLNLDDFKRFAYIFLGKRFINFIIEKDSNTNDIFPNKSDLHKLLVNQMKERGIKYEDLTKIQFK